MGKPVVDWQNIWEWPQKGGCYNPSAIIGLGKLKEIA